MAVKYGKCQNFGSCHLADEHVLQEADETEFACANPDCRQPLAESRGMDKPPGSARRRLAFVVAGILGSVLVMGGVGYLLTPSEPNAQKKEDARSESSESEPSPTESQVSPKKPMAQWINEFSAAGGKPPEPTAPEDYRQTLEAVNRSTTRVAAIQGLKQAGKAIGSEYGLLNPVLDSSLTPEEQDLMNQENQDRRILFAFIAEHSDPPMSYERVANEYVRNRWKEWPPK